MGMDQAKSSASVWATNTGPRSKVPESWASASPNTASAYARYPSEEGSAEEFIRAFWVRPRRQLAHAGIHSFAGFPFTSLHVPARTSQQVAPMAPFGVVCGQ